MTDGNAKKLQIKDGNRIWLHEGGAPGAAGLLGTLPGAAVIKDTLDDETDVTMLFVTSADEVRSLLTAHLAALTKVRVNWICYQKANRVDINRDTLREQIHAFGWRPVSQIALDAEWSALRVRPLTDAERA